MFLTTSCRQHAFMVGYDPSCPDCLAFQPASDPRYLSGGDAPSPGSRVSLVGDVLVPLGLIGLLVGGAAWAFRRAGRERHREEESNAQLRAQIEQMERTAVPAAPKPRSPGANDDEEPPKFPRG